MSIGHALAVASGAGALGGLVLAFALLALGDLVDPFFGILGGAAVIGFPVTISVGAVAGPVLAGWFVWLRGNDRARVETEGLAVIGLALTLGLLLAYVGTGDSVRVTVGGVAMLSVISMLAILPGWGLARLALHNLRRLENNRKR